MKKKAILIFLILYLFGFAAYVFYKHNYEIPRLNSSILGTEFTCSLFSKSPQNKDNCLKIGLINFLNGEKATGLALLDYNCDTNSHDFSCYAFDRLNNLLASTGESINTRPLSLLINRCKNAFTKENGSEICFELTRKLSKTIQDKSLIRMKEIHECFRTGCTLELNREDLFLPIFVQKKIITICESDFEICGLMKKNVSIHDLVNSPGFNENSKEIKQFQMKFTEICESDVTLCENLTLEIASKINLIPMLTLSTFEGIDLSYWDAKEEALQISQDEIKQIKTPYLRYQVLHLRGEFKLIKQSCDESRDKKGCVFQFKDIKEMLLNKEKIDLLCQVGDKYSCQFMRIISNVADEYLPHNAGPFYLINNAPLFIINNLNDDPMTGLKESVHNHLALLITLALIAQYFLSLYLIEKRHETKKIFSKLTQHGSVISKTRLNLIKTFLKFRRLRDFTKKQGMEDIEKKVKETKKPK
jgi:hypothetical protein